MEATGRINGVTRDWKTNHINLSLLINEDITGELDTLMVCEKLSVKLAKYRARRSLDSNAYAWLLMSKLAAALNTTKEDVYEHMLQKYGTFLENEDNMPVVITVKASVDMNRIEGHFQYYKESKDGKWKSYLVILGSSEYDTKQMSTFIEGIVSECKELGIETIPPEELERMVAAWEPKH